MQYLIGLILLIYTIAGFGYFKRISKFDVIWKYIAVILYFILLMVILLIFLEFIAYSSDLLFGSVILFLSTMALAEYLFKQEVTSIFS